MNLAGTWKNFLSAHPDKDAYDEKAESIQQLIQNGEPPVNNFRLLSENKTLLCMTKSLFDKQIQLTFFHSIRKTAILSSNCDHFGLMGFGTRASAVRLDPNVMFEIML